MDHYNQYRRHRLNPDETPIVMQLVWNQLYKLQSTKDDPQYAEQLYHILYRFKHNSVGRPWYPEFTWREVDGLLASTSIEPLDNDPLPEYGNITLTIKEGSQ